MRNRRKIDATITNAQAARDLRDSEGEGSLDALIWSFAPDGASRPRPTELGQLPSQTAESKALSKELKRRGFVFVGPTTMYAAMQACGLVDDHVADCHVAS